ncbi:hypothetical protein N781_01835 [Pontibacillus halophilus JSM 076056 = DSM 19796]|uniref:DegV domain-containing protein n=1 Tax=Pontibacillus halophilus JSM 076056 = DSM 19796 TaxID=1385510 RepID=A0A0A5GRS4_9BACI|nr:hypothetical protein N781_01835 [Pontibacillus halophilus JSM 076056 = DSM 19796]
MKTAIMTDSTAYIPEDLRRKWNIHMVPLNVLIEDESYKEEIDLSASEFYDRVRGAEELPKTSQPSIGLIQEKLEELAEDYDAVISIHLSSGISGTIQATANAGELVDGIDVYPYDSEISCMVQGFFALEGAEMAELGESPDVIISRFDEMKKSMKAYFMVDDLTHLHRGGRLNGAQKFVGSLLKVKPVLHFVDTKIVPFEKIRTRKKALNRVVGLFEEDAQKEVPMRASVIHANREEEAKELMEHLKQRYPHVEFYLSYFGPVIGTHLGEGALGIGWYMK